MLLFACLLILDCAHSVFFPLLCYATGICGNVRIVEHSFTCPFCGEEISMVLDLSVHRHSYVEDCEVCCNSLEISYTVEDDALAEFEAKCLE